MLKQVQHDAGLDSRLRGNDEGAKQRAMSDYKSDLLRSLEERGFIHQLTDAEGLDALAQRQVIPGYIGFDATASSLHVGNLIQIMMLRRLQQAGHKPIVLMGGGTSKIGDPSFKDRKSTRLNSSHLVISY